MTRTTKLSIVFSALAVVAIGVIMWVALSNSSHTTAASGPGVDLSFAEDMVPHHRNAVAMAEIAKTSSERPAIVMLANDIITSQTAEIAELDTLAARLRSEGVTPLPLMTGAHQMPEGMDMESMNTPMDEADMAALRSADQFDRTFIDMMIPHHQMAILMARQVLARGEDPEARRIASAVIAAQSREINQMNVWRRDWYGSESPAGSVPA